MAVVGDGKERTSESGGGFELGKVYLRDIAGASRSARAFQIGARGWSREEDVLVSPKESGVQVDIAGDQSMKPTWGGWECSRWMPVHRRNTRQAKRTRAPSCCSRTGSQRRCTRPGCILRVCRALP